MQNEIDKLALSIMLQNVEYDEMDKLYALNGVLSENYFDKLSIKQQDDVLMCFAIGIQVFNSEMQQAIDNQYNWRRLPSIKVSGYED